MRCPLLWKLTRSANFVGSPPLISFCLASSTISGTDARTRANDTGGAREIPNAAVAAGSSAKQASIAWSELQGSIFVSQKIRIHGPRSRHHISG